MTEPKKIPPVATFCDKVLIWMMWFEATQKVRGDLKIEGEHDYAEPWHAQEARQ